MKEGKRQSFETDAEDVEIDLPLVKITKADVLGALFVHTDNAGELYKDALLKFQTWIMNFAEEQIAPLRDSGLFNDDELETIKKRSCVISPMTLALYLHWLQMEAFIRLTDAEKEKHLLEKMPDRFKARFKGNAACRNAREVLPEEESREVEAQDEAEQADNRKNMSFIEFLKDFGEKVRRELNKAENGK